MQRKVFSLFCVMVMAAGMAPWGVRAATTATLTVTDAGDLSDANPGDGACDTDPGTAGDQCSLRAAIQEVNALGAGANPHHIEFNIAGVGPFTIGPASALPDISVPVIIAGETQPGTTCPTASTPAALQIVLDGSTAGTGATGLILESGSDGSTVRGMVIGNFDQYGIRIYSKNNHIRCTHIGVGVDGTTEMGNRFQGILVNGDDNIIGGMVSPMQRNVISANGSNGISINVADGNQVVNNYIGTTANGMSPLGNLHGIYVNGTNNIIGGKGEIRLSNVISANSGYGVRLNSSVGSVVWGNIIGAGRDGRTPLGNGGDGVEVLGDAWDNIIGGIGFQEPNIIAFNGLQGVLLKTNIVGTPVANVIRGNSIHDNSLLGIELGEDGVDANDVNDVDGGENSRQNYPVLLGSAALTDTLVVTGALDSLPGETFIIDVYGSDECDPSGNGEGVEHLASQEAATDASGHADFELFMPFSPPVLMGGWVSADLTRHVTATATGPDGSTSEFSKCLEVTPPPPVLEWSLFLPLVIR